MNSDSPEFYAACVLLKELIRRHGIDSLKFLHDPEQVDVIQTSSGLDIGFLKRILKPIVQELVDEQFQ